MKSLTPLVVLATAAAPHCSFAQFSYSWNHPSNWGSPQNGAGDILGSFESVNLPEGVLVSVLAPTNGYGPTSTLPALYRTTFDGSVYSQGRYDGDHALLNTSNNHSNDSFDPSYIGDLRFDFARPVLSVGFSLGNMRPGARLWVNGVDQGEFLPKFSTLLQGEYARQGYFRISGNSISSVVLDVEADDTIVIDHLVVTPSPVPEPSSLLALSGLVGICARKFRFRR